MTIPLAEIPLAEMQEGTPATAPWTCRPHRPTHQRINLRAPLFPQELVQAVALVWSVVSRAGSREATQSKKILAATADPVR